jgi:hypothetical protein
MEQREKGEYLDFLSLYAATYRLRDEVPNLKTWSVLLYTSGGSGR